MSQNGYKRMLKSSDSAENELWNQAYRELKAEKEQLPEKLASISKNAGKIFIEATPSEKRTICEIIGSNFIASGKNIDITLYPVFYDIIEMNRLGRSNY